MIRILLLLVLPAAGGIMSTACAQTGHRLFNQGRDFFLEDRATREVKPFEMWNTRLANALFDDRFTQRVVAVLDDYLRYGVNTVAVNLQGGELGPNKNQLYPQAFNADGTLKLSSVVYKNLDRLLDETDARAMVLNIMYWHHRRHLEVPDDQKALVTTRNLTRWLEATGHRNYFLDIVNEYDHYAYFKPGSHDKRPLFSTLQGALQLLKAVKDEDANLLAGLSPYSALLCPVGDVDLVTFDIWTEADILYGHGPILDPLNRAAYRLGAAPANPLVKPYVNNEFFYQLRYELTIQNNPRTGRLSYGHWDRSTIDNYLKDVRTLRGYHGSPNVYSHHQQYIAPLEQMPVAEVGPAGTQPETTPGGGEPSMHWLFRAIADMKNVGALPARIDFNAGHASGLEDDLDGEWAVVNGRLHQTDGNADEAFARIAADEGDLEVSFDASFLEEPGSSGRVGIHLGSPTPPGPAHRLLVGRSSLTLDHPGTTLPPTTVGLPRKNPDAYVLRMAGGRITVAAGGAQVMDVGGIAPITNQNLLLLTRKAKAAFDHVRITPLRFTDFEDRSSGPWAATDPSAWKVVEDPRLPGNRVWEATVPAGKTRQATYDKIFGHFDLHAGVNLEGAGQLAIRFRTTDIQNPWSAGYSLLVHQDGKIVLERIPTTGPAVPVGATTVKVNRESIDVGVTAEGDRISIQVDGATVLDVVDTADAPESGRFQLVAFAGKTRVDNLCIEAGPNRRPTPHFIPGNGPPLPAGFIIDYTDPDGVLDLTELACEVSLDGRTFIDLTVLLHPFFGLFDMAFSPDGKGYRFTLRNPLPAEPGPWTLRASATDRKGRKTAVTYRTG